MKKILLVAILLFASISSGFVYTYQEMIYGYNEYIGKTVNINAYCLHLEVFAYWSDRSNPSEYAYGHIACGDSGANIANYTWYARDPSSSYNYRSAKYGQYFGEVQFYLEAYLCYGEATLTWTI